jgi:hypothetical protein
MIGRRYADHVPSYFRFGVGPFRFSQRIGRTQAQKRAAAKAQAQRQYARQDARRHADWEKHSFKAVPAHDVTHGADGSVSFRLDPPGKPPLHVKLENGRFSTAASLGVEDFTGLREGDHVYGTLGSDGRSLDSLWISLEDRHRYTFVGWAEDIVKQSDGSTTFRVVFPVDPERVWHPEGREPLTVTLQPGEKVRWKDGRPYRMREGSELTVVIDPDGGPPTVYHQTYE